ncbi:MAG TPA: hypothetical protein DD979_10580, partial [Gammaproteobacteria bacterium]|nr:hypothetical protein [Gammaproteobacteria bacterium]
DTSGSDTLEDGSTPQDDDSAADSGSSGGGCGAAHLLLVLLLLGLLGGRGWVVSQTGSGRRARPGV